MQTTGDTLPNQQRRTWFVPALIAAVSFIGGVASNLLASDLETTLRPYRGLVWMLCVVAFTIAVIAAIRDHLRADSSQALPGQALQPVAHNYVASPIREEAGKIYFMAQPAANALHQLPPPPSDFTGREAELKELMTALEAGGVPSVSI